jgi:hypothetical protein
MANAQGLERPRTFADYANLPDLRPPPDPAEKPGVTIVTPVFNGAAMIARYRKS